jgi:hypothetical protein
MVDNKIVTACDKTTYAIVVLSTLDAMDNTVVVAVVVVVVSTSAFVNDFVF